MSEEEMIEELKFIDRHADEFQNIEQTIENIIGNYSKSLHITIYEIHYKNYHVIYNKPHYIFYLALEYKGFQKMKAFAEVFELEEIITKMKDFSSENINLFKKEKK